MLVPGADSALHLRGDQAEACALARQGSDSVPDHLQTAMAGLVELGVVDSDVWSRRWVIQLGGGGQDGGSGGVIVAYATSAANGLSVTGGDSILTLGDGTTAPDFRANGAMPNTRRHLR